MDLNGEKVFIPCDENGVRVDAWLSAAVSDEFPEKNISRSGIKKLIDTGLVLLQGAPVKSSCKVKQGDVFEVVLPKPEILDARPEDIPLDVVYEDNDIIVINKPRGMVVHPAPGSPSGTLVNALLYRCHDLSDINGVIRPGIVHRIDRDTTGLIAVAKNNAAHVKLAKQLEDHSMARVYFAVCEGVPKTDRGTIDKPIGRHPVDRKKMAVNVENGRRAVTHFKVLSTCGGLSLIECRLETGRTHQIRVHMQSIGNPIAGDPLYGIKNTRGLAGQLLHAGKLRLTHPSTGELVEFTAPIPADFKEFLDKNGLEDLT